MKLKKNRGVMIVYKIERFCYLKKIPIIPRILKMFIRIVCGATISYKTAIGNGTVFPHGASGVILHEECVIGENCKIQANVVIGGRNEKPGAPKIGDNVLIGAGAVILGDIKIGNNVSVGANAVVINDLPNDAVAVGVPARVVKIKGKTVKNK